MLKFTPTLHALVVFALARHTKLTN